MLLQQEQHYSTKIVPTTNFIFHLVANPVLVSKLISNINTIHIVVLIIIDFLSKNYISHINAFIGSNIKKSFKLKKIWE